MKTIIKIGIGSLLLGGLSFVIAASTFTYMGPNYKLMVDIGEIAIILWIPLVLIGTFLIVVGALTDQDK